MFPKYSHGWDYFSKTPLQNRYCSASLPSKIEIVATPSERHLPTAMSYFTQGIGFWKWIWKTMGEVDLDFKWAISHLPHQISLAVTVLAMKIWLHQTSLKWFSKAPSASSMLILSRESKFALLFSSDRSKATVIFNSNLTTWKEKLFEKFNLQKQLQPASSPLLGDGRKVFQSSFTVCDSLCSQASLLSWKLTKLS